MYWVITYLLMAMTIVTFYFIVFKRKENFCFALLAVLCYMLSFTAVGMVIFNFENIISYLLKIDFSLPIFNVMFLVLKAMYFISLPMPVIFAYYRCKKK